MTMEIGAKSGQASGDANLTEQQHSDDQIINEAALLHQREPITEESLSDSSHQQSDRKKELVTELEGEIEKYRRLRKRHHWLQWLTLVPMTIAGFLTTSAGNVGTVEVWYAAPEALMIWGLIGVVGSLIIQTANPEQRAQRFELKKDAMRSIRTSLKYRGMDVEKAAELQEIAREDPRQALDALATQNAG